MHRPPAVHPLQGSPEGSDRVEIHHEESDVDIYAIFSFGLGLIVVAALIHLMVFVLFRYFESGEAHVPLAYPLAISGDRLPPEPRLQTDPRQAMSDLRAKEDEWLASYGWVDRNAGVVRIPIDEAMKLTVERGLPAREATERTP